MPVTSMTRLAGSGGDRRVVEDANRKGLALLSFVGERPGQRAADLGLWLLHGDGVFGLFQPRLRASRRIPKPPCAVPEASGGAAPDMTRRHDSLPQLSGAPFLADGGLETCLVFHDGLDLPAFAAFPLLADEEGRQKLRHYFEPFLRLAAGRRIGFVLDTPTWRANTDWGRQLGWNADRLAEVNRASVSFAAGLRDAYADGAPAVVINGVIGPRGDGYRVNTTMTAEEARAYHAPQVEAFRDAGADMVSAITMTYAEEATGIAEAARAAGLPVAISFTVETDGRCPQAKRCTQH
jgi:Homocysteine S-methyltransferase